MPLLQQCWSSQWQERRSSRVNLRKCCAVYAIAAGITLWTLTWWLTADALDSLLGKRHTTLVQLLTFLVFYTPASTILASLYCAWCVPRRMYLRVFLCS